MRTEIENQPAPDAIVAAMAASSGPMLSWRGKVKVNREGIAWGIKDFQLKKKLGEKGRERSSIFWIKEEK